MKRDYKDSALFCENEQVESNYRIYTPSQLVRDKLLYLQEAGTLTAVTPYETGRSGVLSYLFFMVLSGSGSFLYDDIAYKIQSGDCVFIDCQKKYSQISSEDLWTLQWAHFNGVTMETLYTKYVERGGTPVFHTEQSTQYRDILNQLYAMAKESGFVASMELSEKIMSLMTLIMKETRTIEHSKKKNSRYDLDTIKAYLDEHYAEKISLDGLAEQFYMDKYYLTKIFRAQYDTTVNKYLNRVRITKAKEMLRFSDLPVEEIGRMVGIPEPNYFARVFKHVEGITPSTYRAEW